MLFDPTRHEPVGSTAWNDDTVRAAIARFVADTESRYSPDTYWPTHPLDNSAPPESNEPPVISTSLYYGACGVMWGLAYLQAVGAAKLTRRYEDGLALLLQRNRAWLGEQAVAERASFLMGDTPIQLLAYGQKPTTELEKKPARPDRQQPEPPRPRTDVGVTRHLVGGVFYV